MARLGRAALLAVTLLTATLGLSACGTGGAVADARASCVYVHRALALQARSRAPGLPSARRAYLASWAVAVLLKGTPAAAQATSADGSWNPLMTTINEAERVPLENLVATLTRMCAIADSSTPYL
ncbi:MAG: hypothetical protein ACYCPK_00860 [Acidimicrobiales bacterium]